MRNKDLQEHSSNLRPCSAFLLKQRHLPALAQQQASELVWTDNLAELSNSRFLRSNRRIALARQRAQTVMLQAETFEKSFPARGSLYYVPRVV